MEFVELESAYLIIALFIVGVTVLLQQEILCQKMHFKRGCFM